MNVKVKSCRGPALPPFSAVSPALTQLAAHVSGSVLVSVKVKSCRGPAKLRAELRAVFSKGSGSLELLSSVHTCMHIHIHT